MARLHSFFRLVVEQQVSDLHLHAGYPPTIRYNGDLLALPFRTLSENEVERLISEILTEEQREALDETAELDLLYDLPGVARFRGNVFVQSDGLGAVFRVIPCKVPSLDELMLPAAVRRFAELRSGLVLVTGPTGSGKSTTLAALIHEINRTSHRHVITIEDPVEFLHTPIRSAITQRQVGKHTESFAAALRSALREAPDVVVLGEMRDGETIGLALSAAETGVLVFGTLHTSSAAKAVERVCNALPPESRDQARGLLSVVLKGVVAQNLCKTTRGEERVAVMEIMLRSQPAASLIRENKLRQLDGYLHTASRAGTGMQSLDQCILRLVREEVISLEEGLKVANYPARLQQLASELPVEA